MQKLAASMAVLLVLAFGTPAFALDVTADGRVVNTGTYSGPGFTTEDAAFLGTTALGLVAIATASEVWAHAVAPAAFIVWGARRTAKYRPQDVKDRIHANLAAQRAEAPEGSADAILGR